MSDCEDFDALLAEAESQPSEHIEPPEEDFEIPNNVPVSAPAVSNSSNKASQLLQKLGCEICGFLYRFWLQLTVFE
jgi:hypothetical protein